jgi:McrBC 5-methylcytosine restriction system component
MKNAISQGVYKEYVTKSYNDYYIHGAIDIHSFINKNIPFDGRVSSRAREYDYDNSMTQLIRHTVEYLSTDLIGQRILSSDKDIINAVSIIRNCTPTYNKFGRNKVISDNLRGKRHPFFTKYDALRKLCIQILRHEGLRYSPTQTEKKVYGVLFDVAWLWEEYINCIFNDYSLPIIHPQNKIGENGIYLFNKPKRYIRYPDFYSSDKSLVMDAKYKHLMKNYYGSSIDTIDRNDMHQLVAYMYMLKAKNSAFLFPSKEATSRKYIGDLNGYEGGMYLCSLQIPQDDISYKDFSLRLHEEEKVFAENVHVLL